MDIIAMASIGAKYIFDALKQSKTLENTKEKALSKFLEWIQQVFLKKNKQLPTTIEQSSQEDLSKDKIEAILLDMLQEKDFSEEFDKQLKIVRNTFEGNIGEIHGDAHIGENIAGQQQTGNVENEFKGSVNTIKGSFHLGNNSKN